MNVHLLNCYWNVNCDLPPKAHKTREIGEFFAHGKEEGQADSVNVTEMLQTEILVVRLLQTVT
jgi:hypothetical protein